MLKNLELANFIGFDKEFGLNTKNSSLKVVNECGLYQGEFYAPLSEIKKIIGTNVDLVNHIDQVETKDKIKCNEPLIKRPRGGIPYWMVTKEGALEIIKHLLNGSLPLGRRNSINKVLQLFEDLENCLKPATRYKIDLLVDNSKPLECYSDSPDPHKILKKLYENETVKKCLISGKGFDLHIEPDNTFIQRLKV